MTTISYPAVGTGGFTEVQWAAYFDGDDGIINDYTGNATALTRINTGEIARYAPGKIRVGGYVLDITANEDLVVSTTAGTYYTWACYDPALNVAGGGGVASTAGPCTLGISSGLPSTAGGKQYFLLDKIVRAASQALTAAAVTDMRRKIGPSLLMEGALPAGDLASPEVPTVGFGPYPCGTKLFARGSGETYDRVAGTSGLQWRPRSIKGPYSFPLAGGMVAFGVSPQYYFENGVFHVYLRGRVCRSSGSRITTTATSSDVLIGTMPAEASPNFTQAFAVAASNGVPCRIKVESDGKVTVYADSQSVDWVDLSAIQYHVGA